MNGRLGLWSRHSVQSTEFLRRPLCRSGQGDLLRNTLRVLSGLLTEEHEAELLSALTETAEYACALLGIAGVGAGVGIGTYELPC
jgi:hypothetical protein